jgi:hypothetical protein
MRAFVAVSAVAMALLLGSPAKAEVYYPWCAFHDWSTYNCGFTSFQQCQATINGIGGWCQPNPAPAPAPARQRSRHRSEAPANAAMAANYPARAGEPARMVQLPNGRWISSYGCVLDEGYGRYKDCNTPNRP